MTTTTTQRDALTLIRAFETDPAGAIAMMKPMDADETLELTVTLIGLVKVARTVGTELTLEGWCSMLLGHLDNTGEDQ